MTLRAIATLGLLAVVLPASSTAQSRSAAGVHGRNRGRAVTGRYDRFGGEVGAGVQRLLDPVRR